MKLQILVPQYKETDEVVKPLLDSIAVQENIDFKDVGVIIVNDGTDVHLSEELLNSYPFKVEYYLEEHRGVSGTRNACLDKATADYVMFCDADDKFFNVIGLWFLFREMGVGEFDSLTSVFMEENRMPGTKEVFYLERGRMEQGGIDSTFVHGKIHRRKYLIEKNIRWNESLTIHEDSYFNCLCQKCTTPDRVKYCPLAFYLWKWRDDSVCRHDPKYILKTYQNMIASNTALVEQLLQRGMRKDAGFYATSLIYDAWLLLNKKEWIDQENQEYRDTTELKFKDYFKKFKYLFEEIEEQTRNQIYAGIKMRMMNEGVMTEKITFDDWIAHIEKLGE